MSLLLRLTGAPAPVPEEEAIGVGTIGQPTIAGDPFVASNDVSATAGDASASGTANVASASIKPNASQASATGVADTPTPSVRPNASQGAATGVANAPSPNVKPNATLASATGTAFNASVLIKPGASQASATGLANNPASKIDVTPSSASGSGSGLDATASTTTSTNANATDGAATGSGNNTSAIVAPNATAATSSGSANTPTPHVRPTAQQGVGTGTAFNASVSIKPGAALGSGTGSASNPSALIKPNASSGAGTGSATSPGVGSTAQSAAATGTAFNASASIRPNASAGAASGSANTATPSLRPNASAGAASGAANNPSPSLRPNASSGAGTGSSNSPGRGVTPQTATASGTANSPSPNVKPNAGVATGSGTANDATVNTSSFTNATATQGAASGTAFNASVSIRPNASQASATGFSNALGATGRVNSFASTPDSAALDITGDIELVARVALADWSPASSQTIIGKWRISVASRSYQLVQNGTTLTLFASSNGLNNGASEQVGAFFGAAVDGMTYWVKATRVSGTGACALYYAPDQPTEPTSWTLLNAPTMTYTGPIFSGAGVLEVGSTGDGSTFNATGRIYRAIVRDGIGGTTVFDADFSAQPTGTTSFTESSANAATVSIGSAASITSVYNPIGSIKPNASAATGAGASNAPSPNVKPNASQASATGVSTSPTPLVKPNASQASGVGFTTGLTVPAQPNAFASVPDSAALDLSGDIEIVVKASAETWASIVGERLLLAKPYSSGGYYLSVTSASLLLGFSTAADPTTLRTFSSPWNRAGIPDGASLWVRLTRTAATGTGSTDFALDQPNEPTVWTNIGTPAAASGALATNASNLGIGGNSSGANWKGQIFRVIIRHNGVLVLDADFSTRTPGTTSFVEASANAATVTVIGAAAITSLHNAKPNLKPNAALSTASGSAQAPSKTVVSNAGSASASGTADGPMPLVRPNATDANATGSAEDASSVTPGFAAAQRAEGVGTAFNASVKITTNPGLATASGTGYSPISSIRPTVGYGAGTGSAYPVTPFIVYQDPSQQFPTLERVHITEHSQSPGEDEVEISTDSTPPRISVDTDDTRSDVAIATKSTSRVVVSSASHPRVEVDP